MATTFNVRRVGTSDAGSVDANKNYTADIVEKVDIDVPAGVSNQQAAIAFALAKLVAFELTAVGADVTFKTNSSGAPAQTFTVRNGVVLGWESEAGGIPNPITVDVTTVYLTNTSGTLATKLKGFVARNS
jgi:hypothetical protein